MEERPPLLDETEMISRLGKSLKVVAEAQRDIDTDWYEDRINQVMEEDLVRCKKAINTAREDIVEQVFKEIEDCEVKESPFPGFLVLRTEDYQKVKGKF